MQTVDEKSLYKLLKKITKGGILSFVRSDEWPTEQKLMDSSSGEIYIQHFYDNISMKFGIMGKHADCNIELNFKTYSEKEMNKLKETINMFLENSK